ncbi:MAG TPA: PTS sugar transporter subunit IIA [Candidatus Hydrogenedentes bacterium]|nr:PTS sugar transporter subunit IIA [Candidatus Hydrogenedentota bacterium]HQM48728.1 PTS sugar transporter subunit IIA [Candidatus Hydrogenedentota bacterium]
MAAFGIDIDRDRICVFKKALSKHDALCKLVDALFATGGIPDREAFRKAVCDREAVMSTGIGQGLAIPHVRFEGVRKPAVGVGISKQGIDFDTLDNQVVHVIVLFAMPAGSQKEYLGLLAQVMTALKEPKFLERLVECDTPEEVEDVLAEDV